MRSIVPLVAVAVIIAALMVVNAAPVFASATSEQSFEDAINEGVNRATSPLGRAE